MINRAPRFPQNISYKQNKQDNKYSRQKYNFDSNLKDVTFFRHGLVVQKPLRPLFIILNEYTFFLSSY